MRIFLILFTIVFSSYVMGGEVDPILQKKSYPFQNLCKGMQIRVDEERNPKSRDVTLHFVNTDHKVVLSKEVPFHFISKVVQVDSKTLYIQGIEDILHPFSQYVSLWKEGQDPSKPTTYGFSSVKNIHSDTRGNLYVVGVDADADADADDHSDLCSVIRITGDDVSQRTTYGFHTVHEVACAPDGSLYVVGDYTNQKYAVSHVINDEPSPLTIDGLHHVHTIIANADGSFYAKGEIYQEQDTIVQGVIVQETIVKDAIVYVSKDGEAFPPNTFNLKSIVDINASRDNCARVVLSDAEDLKKIRAYRLFQNRLSQPLNTYDLNDLRYVQESQTSGDLYLRGARDKEYRPSMHLYIPHDGGRLQILNNVLSVLFLD